MAKGFLRFAWGPNGAHPEIRDWKGAQAAESPNLESLNRSGCLTGGMRWKCMFAFFSSRLGCLGSIGVSIIGSLILFYLMRGCSGAVQP